MRRALPRLPLAAYPAIALVVLVVLLGVATGSFPDLSLVAEQSLFVGTLALGQLLVIRAGGIDLAAGAVAVLGTVLMANLAGTGTAGPLALLAGVAVTTAIGAAAGGLVRWQRLPPFLVTFALLAIVAAVSRIYADGATFAVVDDTLGFLGTTKYLFGRIELTYGMGVLLVLAAGLWFAVARRGWCGGAWAYAAAGAIYGLAAWQALGRVPIADPAAYPLGTLDAITAVVIGGTSLFAARVSVVGAVLGALVISVLRLGLAQATVDVLYQDVVIGVLLIVAVAVDRYTATARDRRIVP
jgi:fructose transport system permease protein